jgi:hypothetical protein
MNGIGEKTLRMIDVQNNRVGPEEHGQNRKICVKVCRLLGEDILAELTAFGEQVNLLVVIIR